MAFGGLSLVITESRCRSTKSDRETVSSSLTRQMVTGLHLAIGRTGRTAVDDISVVTEDACELLRYVGATVATSCACGRRFHGLPILLGGFHGWMGGTRTRRSGVGHQRRSITAVDQRRRRHRDIAGVVRASLLSRGVNVDKGRRPFTRRTAVRTAKYRVSGLYPPITAVCHRMAIVRQDGFHTEFRWLALHSTGKQRIDLSHTVRNPSFLDRN